MQVPEKLALIGGSILLSSTLVFTLKSQASSIIPSVGHSISHVFDHIGDAQKSNDFDSNFQQARQKHWQTGQWGTVNYYIDSNNNMYVGKGNLNGSLHDTVGENVYSLKTVNFTAPVRAPQNSYTLLSGAQGYWDRNNSITHMSGLNNLDTSQVTNMDSMFVGNTKLNDLDVSNWDTRNVTDVQSMFVSDNSLTNVSGLNDWDTNSFQVISWLFDGAGISNVDLSHWNTQHVHDMRSMFADNHNLKSVDIGNFDSTNADTLNMFTTNTSNLNDLTLGNRTYLKSNSYLIDGIWKNNDKIQDSNQLNNNSSHPGNWTRIADHNYQE